MHVQDESTLGSFLSDSIRYQTGEVLAMYVAIFAALAVICIGYYQSCRLRGNAVAKTAGRRAR